MSCWNGHVPHMSEAQIAQATEAYFKAEYARNYAKAWSSPGNPFTTSQTINLEWRTEPTEPPASKQHRRTTSLAEAQASDKAGAIDVEYVRVR